MSVDEDDELLHQLNGVRRTQSVYQQASTGEKHVLFYPTNPSRSLLISRERPTKAISSTSACNLQHMKNKHKSSSSDEYRMNVKQFDGGGSSCGDENPSHFPHTANINPVTMNSTNSSTSASNRYSVRIGIYGWRKRCLYVLILILLIMVVVNLALTLWMLKVMEFSSQGMGQLKIVSGGLRLDGKAFILDTLVASSIKSRTGQPIVVESSQNFTLSARNSKGFVDNQLFVGNDRFECLTKNFHILNSRGLTLFQINDEQVVVGAKRLRITGEGGTAFGGSIQTRLMRAEPGNELRLESPTRTVSMHGAQGITLEARNGRIHVIALDDITFRSVDGAIRLEAHSIHMPHLVTAKASMPSPASHTSLPPPPPPPNGSSNHNTFSVFQLCVCHSGKLFLAPSHSHCAHEEGDRVCR